MEKIGRKIFEDNPQIYTDVVIGVLKRNIDHYLKDADVEEKESALYRSIYDYWVYGSLVDEEFYLDFPNKTHQEKSHYITDKTRRLYYRHLNESGEARCFLHNKYGAYELFKDYYKRDVISCANEGDYEKFLDFVKKHSEFVIKPIDSSGGFLVSKDSIESYQNPRELFNKILNENMILEELITAAPEMTQINPSSVNAVRITTVRIDGGIHFFYPWIKVGVEGRFIDNRGLFAGINSKTGVVDTDFFDVATHYRVPLERHPDTNFKIRGFQIPHWNEAVTLINELMGKLENINYVGWDLAFTESGWVVIEGNNGGSLLMPEVFSEKGLREELEQLIGWKLDKKFWWQ